MLTDSTPVNTIQLTDITVCFWCKPVALNVQYKHHSTHTHTHTRVVMTQTTSYCLKVGRVRTFFIICFQLIGYNKDFLQHCNLGCLVLNQLRNHSSLPALSLTMRKTCFSLVLQKCSVDRTFISDFQGQIMTRCQVDHSSVTSPKPWHGQHWRTVQH